MGVAPEFIIVKNLGTSSTDWGVYLSAFGATKYALLNSTGGIGTASSLWNDTEPTSTLFSIGTSSKVNTSTDTYVAYCFAGKRGYSKFGSYTGYDTSDGPFIYTGFRPAFLLIKRDASGAWWLANSSASPTNVSPIEGIIRPNSTAAQTSDASETIDILSNGFKLRSNGGDINYSGTYYYMAFAEFPIVSSNDVPVVAR